MTISPDRDLAKRFFYRSTPGGLPSALRYGLADFRRDGAGLSVSDYPRMASRDEAARTLATFQYPATCSNETANWLWGTRSPGSEDSMRGFTQLAWKKKCVGTASINSDLLGTTRIKKSAAQKIVSVVAAQTTIGKSSLKIPIH